MFTENDVLEHLHPKLSALIAHEKRVCGCMMKAVKAVAQRTGVSEFWVRRITGRYGKVKVQAHQFFNVIREHVRIKREKISRIRKTDRRTFSSAENSTPA